MRLNVKAILDGLEALYPDAAPELTFNNPFELLIAVILSAQCTDVRVNQVTAVLFREAPNARALADMPLADIERIVKPCGLYKTKSKNIKATAQILCDQFEGRVPEAHAALVALPGVGRKTANVVVSNAFGVPAIAVDTHVFRVSNRIGLAKSDTVLGVEAQLMKRIPKRRWTLSHHLLIFHGRRVCKARKPNCEQCGISDYCRYGERMLRDTVSSGE